MPKEELEQMVTLKTSNPHVYIMHAFAALMTVSPCLCDYILLSRGNIKRATNTINTPPVAYVTQGLAMRDSTIMV